MSNQLLPCPFCGGTPHFDGNAADWQDESRYVELSLKCCATMTEAIGWRRARDMTVEARTAELQTKLTDCWNTRHADAAMREYGELCHKQALEEAYKWMLDRHEAQKHRDNYMLIEADRFKKELLTLP